MDVSPIVHDTWKKLSIHSTLEATIDMTADITGTRSLDRDFIFSSIRFRRSILSMAAAHSTGTDTSGIGNGKFRMALRLTVVSGA